MNSNDLLLYPGMYYHIYNHGNANDNIFLNDDNFAYFLKKYAYFINPVADTFAYCLMPNHFHFVVCITTEEVIAGLYREKHRSEKGLQGEELSLFISQQFSNFFNAYSKAFNKMNGRIGKLFRLPFKRKPLGSIAYLLRAIHYVHSNPVQHGFVKDMRDWIYSSIHSYETNRRTNIRKEEGLELFNGIDGFRFFHNQPVDEKYKLEMKFS